ncbi:MAG: type IV pilus assembly protein PilM [Clostridia bacterium]|jgi:type IV pilus assembly protein PilM
MSLQTKAIIGIDVGSSQVKMVQTNAKGEVIHWGIGHVPKDLFRQGKVEAIEPLVDTLRKIIKEKKIKGRRCALCYSGNDVIIRELQLPVMTDQQIELNIQYELSEYLPLDPLKYSIEYRVLDTMEEQDTASMRVMVVAALRESLQVYMDILKKAGVKPVYIDIPSNVREKLLRYALSANSQQRICVVDIGASMTEISLYHNGVYFTNKTTPIGAQHLTAMLSEYLHIDELAAERWKTDHHYMERGLGDSLRTQIISYLEQLVQEVSRVVAYYQNRNYQSEVEKIYLMGGGSLLKGLPEYLEEHLGIKVSYINELLLSLEYKHEVARNGVFLADAIGTTLRVEG